MGWAQRDVPSLSAPQQCPLSSPWLQSANEVALPSATPPGQFQAVRPHAEQRSVKPIGDDCSVCAVRGFGAGDGSARSVCEPADSMPVSSTIDESEGCDVSLERALAGPATRLQFHEGAGGGSSLFGLGRQLTGARGDEAEVLGSCGPRVGAERIVVPQPGATPDNESGSDTDLSEDRALSNSHDYFDTSRVMHLLSQTMSHLFTEAGAGHVHGGGAT